MNGNVWIAAAAAAWMGFAAPASAHITLEQASAPVGSYYKAVLRVPHGCQGAATTQISVKIPEGVIAVKPQPKPGWTLAKTRGSYAHAYTLHGGSITEGVQTVTWSGGTLPDDEFDEFAFMAYLAPDLKPGSALYFPTVQTCERGVDRWIQIPSAQQSWGELPSPAPVLHLLPAESRGTAKNK